MSTLIALLRFLATEGKSQTKKKGKTMNPLTRFKKILILPLLSLGVIFLLAINAHAQNLYVTTNRGVIFEYTPNGTQSTYASGLTVPRGLAFDNIGNLFVGENFFYDDIGVGRLLKFNVRNKVTTVGNVSHSQFAGVATDAAGNVYVMGNGDVTSTIYKFVPGVGRSVFGSVPGSGVGLAFDSAGNLYAAAAGPSSIYKFDPNGARTVFVGPSAFAEGTFPVGLAFDSGGDLFVSTNGDTGSDTILEFTPNGTGESTFATGLNNPRGLAFDADGNLFVAERVPFPHADILEFFAAGGSTVFASGLPSSPQFLTFGPPR
jgi:sugar lactone lactonase YvrE